MKQAITRGSRAEDEWQHLVTRREEMNQDVAWVRHMTEARSWSAEKSHKQILFVETEKSVEWQTCLAKDFEEELQSGPFSGQIIGVITHKFPKEHCMRSAIARSIILQALSAQPELLSDLEAIHETILAESANTGKPDYPSRKRQITSWKTSLLQSNPSWEYLWRFLGCILRDYTTVEKVSVADPETGETEIKTRVTPKNTSKVAILLVGCEDQIYRAINDDLKCITKLKPTVKFLIIGKPLLDSFVTSPNGLTHNKLTARINEETELLGLCFNLALVNLH